MAACKGGVTPPLPPSCPVSGDVKANGAECGLSVASLKVAVKVKLVVVAVSVTLQSMAVAFGSVDVQTATPSW